MNVFDEMGIYWAEMADKRDTERQIKFIKQTLTTKGLILDLACGTGRHSIPLSKDGYDMVGLDVSPRLLKIAKNRWSRVQVVRGDMRFLPFKAGVFSGVISMDSSFGYLPLEQDDIQSLNEIEKILGPNGVFAVDVFNWESLIQKYKNRNKSKLVLLSILLRFHNLLSSWVMPRFFKWTEFQSFSLLKVRTVTSDSSVVCLRDLWVVCDKTSQ
jgi:SAM-dependent methyltransferase